MDKPPTNSKRFDGGCAFPRPAVVTRDDCNQLDVIQPAVEGMSLADWFAGMALQGMLSSGNYACDSISLVVCQAWDISLEMLTYSEKNTEKGGDHATS